MTDDLARWRAQNGTLIVRAPRQLVKANRTAVKAHLRERMDEGWARLVLDFGKLGYLDSSGLGLLVSTSRYAREKGCDFVLAHVEADVATLFNLTHMDTLLTVLDGAPEGVEDAWIAPEPTD